MAITATYPRKFSIALRLPNTETHTPLHTHAHTLVCQVQRCSLRLRARKSNAVCIHGPCLEEEGWSASCAHNSTQPRGPGDSLTPPSASITPHHCDGHKSWRKRCFVFLPHPLASSWQCWATYSTAARRKRRRSIERTELCRNAPPPTLFVHSASPCTRSA